MTTLEGAWQAFMAAVAEAQALHASGAGAEVLQDPLRRVTELSAVQQYSPFTAPGSAHAVIAPTQL